MDKATICFKGTVAELMEEHGILHAKIVCDTDSLLISVENVENLELGGDVTIEGELKIKSIQFKEMGHDG
ncbi:MAG: hypothetical protein GXO86_03180 [Chlorobi bacterium]|nr:hypothetical protein [Chlorobiota bacterium]